MAFIWTKQREIKTVRDLENPRSVIILLKLVDSDKNYLSR
jgi:hypothetical protein